MLTIAVWIAQALLVGVFALAGLAKLVDRAGTRQALTDFNVPARLVPPAAALLPTGELAVAGALLAPGLTRIGAAGSLVLLALFTAAITASLAKGEQPGCHCFGQLRSAPIGAATLRRNAALGSLSALVLWLGPGRLPPALAGLTAAERLGLATIAVLTGVVVLQGWAVLNLLRRHGGVLLRLDALEALVGDHPGLPVGSVAPPFELPAVTGERLSLDALLAAGRPVLLIFADPFCGPCNTLLPEVGRWQRDYTGAVTIAVISRGDPALNRKKAHEHRLGGVLLQSDREVAHDYQTTATPSAVLVGTDQRILSPVVAGGAAIRSLLLRAPNARPASRPSPAEVHLDDTVEVFEELTT